MFRGVWAFVVFLIAFAIGSAGTYLPASVTGVVAGISQVVMNDHSEISEATAASDGLRPCRNDDGVTLVRGDVIRVGDGRLKAYFALSNEGTLPIYFSSDNRRNLTEVLATDSRVHEIKPYSLEWVLLPVAEDDRPFETTIQYRQSGFGSVRWFTASFSGTNKFPDACS